MSEFKVALRSLLRSRTFTVSAVLALGISIAANALIFAVVNSLLLRPLPVDQAGDLARIYSVAKSGSRSGQLSYPDFEFFREHATKAGGLAGGNISAFTVEAGGVQEQALGEVASGNYFQVLRAPIVAGRAFTKDDEQAVVISRLLATRLFGSVVEAVRGELKVNGATFAIAGVADDRYKGTFAGASAQIWVPVAAAVPAMQLRDLERGTLQPIARLAPAATRIELEQELNALAARRRAQYPQREVLARIETGPATLLHGALRNRVAGFFFIVMAIVGGVLVVAALNVGGLVIVRGTQRQGVIALRYALGAQRRHILKQLAAEALLISGAGAGLGLLLAVWSGSLLEGWRPVPFLPLQVEAPVDLRVVGFAGLTALAAALLVIAIPLLQRHAGAWNLRGAMVTHGVSRLHKAFVAVQVAVTFVMIVAAALLLQSLRHSSQVDVGIAVERGVAVDMQYVADMAGEEAYYQRLLEHVRALPYVEGATLADRAIPDISLPWTRIRLADVETRVSVMKVEPQYFSVLQVPLVSGRAFDDRDTAKRPLVAMVSDATARRLWPGRSPIGERFNDEQGRAVEIVGVVADTKYRTLGEDPTLHIYLPFAQHQDSGRTLLLRTRSDPKPALPLLRREIESLDARARATFERTLQDHLGVSLLPSQVGAALFGIFGFMASVLAGVGFYGVVAYTVTQRTHDFGVHLAMGATPANLMMLVGRGAVRLMLIGVVAGAVISALFSQLLARALQGVDPLNAVTWLAALLAVALMTALATAIPALHAARLSPTAALRAE